MSLRKIPLPDIKKNVIKLFTKKGSWRWLKCYQERQLPLSCSLHALVMAIVTGQKTRHIL